jgi:hypothetical protein
MEASKKNLLLSSEASKPIPDLVVANQQVVVDMDESASGPRLLRVTVVSVQHLPKMDSFFGGGKCDPYVKLEFRGIKLQTEVIPLCNVHACRRPVLGPMLHVYVQVENRCEQSCVVCKPH